MHPSTTKNIIEKAIDKCRKGETLAPHELGFILGMFSAFFYQVEDLGAEITALKRQIQELTPHAPSEPEITQPTDP